MKKIKGLIGLGKKGGATFNQPPDGASAKCGYDVREKDLQKIHKAAWTGDIAKVKQLAKKDVSALDKENRTPLHFACAAGHANVVQELLEWSAKTNIGDNQHKTPLMKAVECSQEECVRLLVEYHTEVDVTDGDGNSALHIAIKEGHTNIAALLIHGGAKINLQNKKGYTPLHLCVVEVTTREESTRMESTKMLLDNKADPNLVDNEKRTPLHHACSEDAINHVKLLLQYNANTNIKDSKGWTAEDCAMMKANYGCSQYVFNHNLQQRAPPSKSLGGSVPTTPRGRDSLPPSSQTVTPRSDMDLFGPQEDMDAGDDSDDQTPSKTSVIGDRQDSWADDSEMSSAVDDPKKKHDIRDDSDLDGEMVEESAQVKVSLARNVNLDESDDDDERQGGGDNRRGESPAPRPGSGDVSREIITRTPTPTSPISHSPKPSKIPVKAPGSPLDEDLSLEGGSSTQRNRVSFKADSEEKFITTEEDTDVDEEEAEPIKKRRIATPEDDAMTSVYTPSVGGDKGKANNLTEEKIRAMMRDLGLSEVSDVDTDSDLEEDQVAVPLHPILKPSKGSSGKPPSVQQPVDTDPYIDSEESVEPWSQDEESEWDSTKHSETDKVSQPAGLSRTLEGAQSPEYDSDLEGTLNPDNSHVEKENTVNEAEDLTEHAEDLTEHAEDLTEHQDTNTLEVIQESTTPDNPSSIEKLANTGELNALLINELNESSTDLSNQGSRSSRGMAVIEEENTEVSEHRSEFSMTTETTIKRRTVRAASDADTESETIDRIEISHGNLGDTIEDNLGDTLQGNFGDALYVENEVQSLAVPDDEHVYRKDSVLIDDVDNLKEIQNEGFRYDNEEVEEDSEESMDDNEEEDDDIEDLIDQEIGYFDNVEAAADIEQQVQTSIREEIERSLSEGHEKSGRSSRSHSEGRRRGGSFTSDEFKVMDRKTAPKCVFEYEPSTTEAESGNTDSDGTLETESLQDDLMATVKLRKQLKSPKDIIKKQMSRSRNSSMSSDKEVARALHDESPCTFASRQAIPTHDDFNRHSVDPTTQDTLDDDASSLGEEEAETSQWDSTEEAFTPRTPRELDHGFQDSSPAVQEVEPEEEEESDEEEERHEEERHEEERHEEEEEDEIEVERLNDHIEDAVTSFNIQMNKSPAPSFNTLEPKSDSSHLHSRTTPEIVTSSGSGSQQKTVIAIEKPTEVEPESGSESDWDSEDEHNSDLDSTGVININQDGEVDMVVKGELLSPRTPRGRGTASTVSDEESISEWELEKQREREQQMEDERLKQMEDERLKQMEDERLKQEEMERLAHEEEMRQLQEIEEEEERQREWEKEEEERQEALQREAEEHERREQEEEMRRLEELEAEEERQRIWEEEERKRQEQLELEGERLRNSQEVNDSDESDDFDSEHVPIPDHTQPDSHHSDRSQGSDVMAMSPMSNIDQSNPSSVTSPRSARELKKPPPKLVVSQFLYSPKESSGPVQNREIEDESPAPVQAYMENVNQHALHGVAPSARSLSGPREEEGSGDVPTEDSDDDVEDIDEVEVVDGMAEQLVQPVHTQQVHTSHVNQEPAHVNIEPPYTGHISREPTHRPEVAINNNNGQLESGTQETLFNVPPPLPSVAPPAGRAMSLQSDGNSVEEDFDDDLDIQRSARVNQVPSYTLPDLSGNTGLYMSGLEVPFDDDGLSVTSTENGDISSSYRPENLPYGKDMLATMNFNDSNAVLKLQEVLREHRRQLEHERSQRMLLENRQKLITKEKVQLQKSIDSVKHQKSVLEQNKLDLEARIRNLEYSMNEETEKRKNAELLLMKTKEHLDKKEEQFTQEMELKQRAELSMRNVQMSLRSTQNQIKELEDEKAELERLLGNEKNARQLQEKINEEQQRLQQHIQDESLNASSQREEARSALDLADDDVKHARDKVEKFKNETIALKAELQRQRSRLTEENTMLTGENEKLQQRVDDLRNEVRLNEEALTQLTVQQNLHQSKLLSESTMLSNTLDKESVAREKAEAELDSAKTRLHATTVQLEKSQQARNEFERRLHGDREDWALQLERKEQELTNLKEKLQTMMHNLNSTETKLNAVENELQISNTTLLERSNQYQQSQRDLQYYKTAQENYDTNYRHEKDQNSKLLGKIESLQERLSGQEHEKLSLRQQLETAQHAASDRSGVNLQDKLNTMISGLKDDHEKARTSLEEKNNVLQDTISRLREDVRNSENRRSNLEQDIRRLNQEQNDLIRKLSIAEATLDVATKARDHLEQERVSLKLETEKFQQKYHVSQERAIEAQTKMGDLSERLQRTEQNNILNSQQLADSSANMHAFNTSKSELEENYQKLQVDKVRVDAELKHEKQKSEMLHRDLLDSQKVRSSLEALCSNLKSTNAHLEEKLGGESVKGNLLLKEAEDHKDLWEQEVLSRSKLGLRIAQLERHKQETVTQLEEEKRRTRKAVEQKKIAETKLESEQDKCNNLLKEVANLKAYLKVAKKKLKALDNNDARYSNLHSAFDRERGAMEEMLLSVRSQLEHMKLKLEEETDEKERVNQKNLELEKELKTIKKLERSVEKIDRSKKRLEQEFQTYKNNVETGFTDKATAEATKKELEARYRQELNRKLDEVNGYLEEQARSRSRLDTSREEQETKLRLDKKRIEDELMDVRLKYEQALAQKESKELEAQRYRDLYESEMQWRMKLSDQLHHSTDKTFNMKSKLVAERQRARLYGSLSNLSVNNGHATLDFSRINGSLTEDALSNKLRAELDRSIAKHLEAAPHDQIRPLVRHDDSMIATSNFAKANADYIEVLKRKYCV